MNGAPQQSIHAADFSLKKKELDLAFCKLPVFNPDCQRGEEIDL
jgi:hypothetical protein